MIVKLKNLNEMLHKYVLGQKRCPECGKWMFVSGYDIHNYPIEEFYCEYCKKYFYL